MSYQSLPSSEEPECDWEFVPLLRENRAWSEAEFLDLTDGSSPRIEFCDGQLQLLPSATEIHESLASFIFRSLYYFADESNIGTVFFNGIRLRIRPGLIRRPDIIFLHKDHYHVRHNRVWDGADLVMEVVSESPNDRQRDYEIKLADYAEAKIAEYWIIDYELRKVLVYRLDGDCYATPTEFTPNQQAVSQLLSGFTVDVSALFAAAEDVPE